MRGESWVSPPPLKLFITEIFPRILVTCSLTVKLRLIFTSQVEALLLWHDDVFWFSSFDALRSYWTRSADCRSGPDPARLNSNSPQLTKRTCYIIFVIVPWPALSTPPWPGPCPLSVCCHWVHRVRVNKEQDAASVRLWETHWVTSVSVILSCISHSCSRAAIMQYVVWCCCWPRVKLRLKVTSITIVVFSWCPAQPGGTESWWG